MGNAIETIKNWPLRNQMIFAAVIAMSIAGMVLLFSWSQKADHQVLFTNLSEGDSGLIVQKLRDMKVAYRVENGSILVPADKVYDLRFQLAAQGLPQGGGIGFELFDKTNFGTTDFVQKLNYRRAMQGELSRTITSLSEVEQCRVHLAIPEKSLFAQESSKPSASVFLKLKPGRALAQGQVMGIVHLVSSSVEGLNPKDVTVVDSRGEMLTRPVSDIAGLSSGQLEYQKNYEKDVESRIMGILEPIVGKDKVRTKATVAIDFTRSENTEEKYDPDGQVVRSEQKNMEKSTSGGSGGVPGVASNLPGKAQVQASATQGQSQRQSETINYEINKITRHVVNSSGNVKKLSIAVIVDGVYAAQEGAKEKKYAPRSEEDIRHYEDLVKKAVGFSAERGDEVKVTNMPFEVISSEEIGATPKQYMPIILTALKYIIPLLGAVFFFLFILKPLLKTLSMPVTVSPRSPELPFPQTVAEIERTLETKAMPVKTDVIEWAKKNPNQAASLVKGWIEER